ncbi:MAG TPA: ISNCY family transposase [Methylomirabilota bacterium]|nr:ISNCY family transposase [Methylomirabilota bacterium]
METFTLSRKEVHRPGLLKAACAGRVTNAQVAAALGLSIRHVRRLKRRFETGGAAALVHRSRGRPSGRQLPVKIREAVIRLMTTVYAGFNDRHLTEKLREVHQLPVSRETVRRLRIALGRPPQRARRAPRARHRRVPEAAAGALIQIDGSPFAWLEDRGPEVMLLGAVDDATTQILALQFRPAEDVHGYATLFATVFGQHGLPLAVYGDRLNLLIRNDRHWSLDEQLAGAQTPTHLGRMLQELGIAYIAARSPQAKGRIERLWQTLQDRLVSELRLRGLATVEAAQAYLPDFIRDFNARFGKPPRAPHAVWRRPPRDLALVLGCRYRRVVARDNTVRVGPRWVQLRGRQSYAGRTVDVRELLDGRLVVLDDDRVCGEEPSPSPAFILKPRRHPSDDRRRPPRSIARPLARRLPKLSPKTHTGRRPLPAHPWIRQIDADIRRRERTTGRTFSRRSDGGPIH